MGSEKLKGSDSGKEFELPTTDKPIGSLGLEIPLLDLLVIEWILPFRELEGWEGKEQIEAQILR